MTNPKALKELATALEIDVADVPDKNVAVLNAIAENYQGEGSAETIPEALENIAAVADNIGSKPEGSISITANGNNIDVAPYATANVAVPVPKYVDYTFNSSHLVTKMTLHNFTNIDLEASSICTAHKATLVEVDLSDCPDVTMIGSALFDGCAALTTVVFPPNASQIRSYAFRGCTSYAITEIPSQITALAESAFWGCTGLVSLKFHENLNPAAARTVFKNCTGLKNVEIASATFGSTVLNPQIFDGCSGLEKVWIRGTCTRINANTAARAPLYGCPDTVAIYAEADSKPDNWGTYYNKTGSGGAVDVTVTFGQTTSPF